MDAGGNLAGVLADAEADPKCLVEVEQWGSPLHRERG